MARILVAEDERDIRDLICFTLRFAGHEVFAATNGEEVVELGPKIMPDLFLLDVRMPRMTGYEACEIMKIHPRLYDIPVVFLSAKAQESEIQQGLDAGAEEYLLKPFAPDQLTMRVKAILAKFEVSGPQAIKKDKDQEYVDLIIRKFRQLRNEAWRLRDENDNLAHLLSQAQQQAQEHPHQTSNDLPPLAELSRITDGIVHDIRNGMGIIRNTIGFMSDDLSGTSHEADILKITQSLDFCELVLRNLSALGGQDRLTPTWIDLKKLILDIGFMLERKLVDVKLVTKVGWATSTKIFADEGHMKQVFMNLIKNAGEAMPEGGTLTCTFNRKNEMLQIELKDTGIGITKENRERLFRQLFTTKERGYGVGLFVVSTVVKRYGGKISVKSKLGKGTTFTLLLPVQGVSQ